MFNLDRHKDHTIKMTIQHFTGGLHDGLCPDLDQETLGSYWSQPGNSLVYNPPIKWKFDISTLGFVYILNHDITCQLMSFVDRTELGWLFSHCSQCPCDAELTIET